MLLRVFLMLKSNHSKMFQCLRNRSFLFRRALWLPDILGFRLIVVLTLDDTALLLYLCDIQAADFQAAVFQNIILDLPIGCQSSLILHHFFHIHINVDMYCRFSQN